jgi:hypothetical protein
VRALVTFEQQQETSIMAAVLPKPVVARIQWAENHVTPFSTNAVAIGITSAIATDFQTKTEAARAALQARDAADQAATDRNNDLRLAMIALTDAASAIVNTVHAKADSVGDSVYSLASIPVPGTPSPRPAPGQPTGFKVELNADGSIKMTWKCDNAGSAGTMYQVYRRTAPTGEFTALGVAGLREFTDATIPAGSSQVTYKVRAVRSTVAGPWAEYNVTFGVGSSGAMTASVESAPKLAA